MPLHEARAVNTLQLDILGGVYVGPPEETIFTNDPIFTLYAYLVPDANAPLTDTYYISAALTWDAPVPPPPGAGLGSFAVDPAGALPSVTYDVTGDMTFGTPPISAPNSQNLQGHGIYDTYFIEIPFTFNPSNEAAQYNTATDTGDGPGLHPGTGMYYQAFNVDILGFDSSPGSLPPNSYRIHFDLYNVGQKCKPSGCVTEVASFAPFSHDAEDPPVCVPGDPSCSSVPEPASVLLTGVGLLGLAAFRKKWSGR